MTTEVFEENVNTFLADLRTTLIVKAKQYGVDSEDRLSNFKSQARFINDGFGATRALWGNVSKHLDCINQHIITKTTPSEKLANELCGDVAAYMILLQSLWQEERTGLKKDSLNDVTSTEGDVIEYKIVLKNKGK